jgi:hypothetical protein
MTCVNQSAEWIAETINGRPLAQFGSWKLTDGQATTANGKQAVKQLKPTPINLVTIDDKGAVNAWLAGAGVLNQKEAEKSSGFTVTRQTEDNERKACPAP